MYLKRRLFFYDKRVIQNVTFFLLFMDQQGQSSQLLAAFFSFVEGNLLIIFYLVLVEVDTK